MPEFLFVFHVSFFNRLCLYKVSVFFAVYVVAAHALPKTIFTQCKRIESIDFAVFYTQYIVAKRSVNNIFYGIALCLIRIVVTLAINFDNKPVFRNKEVGSKKTNAQTVRHECTQTQCFGNVVLRT